MSDAEKAQRTVDIFCHTCNVQIAANITATHVNETRKYHNIDPVDDHYEILEYALAVCGRCESVSLLQSTHLGVEGESFPQRESILYPADHRIPTDELPESVLPPYLNAVRSFQCALYEPCLIMCRKCLEAICRELNGKLKHSLHRNLGELRENGRIDERLWDWANELRLIGNDAVHDPDINVDVSDARDALEFLEAILMYTFLLSRRFDEFKKRRIESQDRDGHG